MKRGLMRPTDILFPLAGIAAALLNFPEILTETILYYYMLQIFSLCAVDSFRNAAAREPGVRRVDKRFGGALIAKDYPTWHDIDVKEEWAAWARDVIVAHSDMP